jgi:uncharacterized damage-inducible protein DinB
MTPNNAIFLRDFLLPQLISEQAVTHKILASVPPDQDQYQPSPISMTAFQLARHITICELWFLDAILNGQFGPAPRPPASATTCQALAAWYAESTAQRIPQLQQLPAESLTKAIDYIGLRNDPAVAYLNIAIRHTAHHRGQLSTYLRAMGASVPAIYVESADEPYPPEDGSIVIPPAF